MKHQDRLIASFILDRSTDLEIALRADHVVEATSLGGRIQAVPSSADFLEGYMTLRQEVLPIINLKKRLKLAASEYGQDAKVAVIQMAERRYGLLFEDIRDVFRVEAGAIEPLAQELMAEGAVITDLITLENGERTLEFLDLELLFPFQAAEEEETESGPVPAIRSYQRQVIFSCCGQRYGVSAADTQEICFFADLDPVFRQGEIEGALQLRGHTIPVLNSAAILRRERNTPFVPDSQTRILVMRAQETVFGMIVDGVHKILMVGEDEILPIPGDHLSFLAGVCREGSDQDIILLHIPELIEPQLDKIKAMGQIRNEDQEEPQAISRAARHIITQNSYLIFTIGKHYAIELRDVQEILDTDAYLNTDSAGEMICGIINLRGTIVPVMDLRRFYPIHGERSHGDSCKLVIAGAESGKVALLVDEIVTIFKQEQYHATPSLRPELQEKKDTLDRLIEFINEEDLMEHVLVLNVKNIVRNHLGIVPENAEQEEVCRQGEEPAEPTLAST
ncbi:chemotaxis protein CheW [Desulfogranum mediterraneum]|uniref:chemotaxis protein CheW n=1 Tax=Desulfogranum mediterraneum TaxID=160661 RepID=UPI000423A2BC|nr:chemotaxis protein CheW [Desulfogranum mediterraneum]